MNEFFDSFGKTVNETARQAIRVSGEMYEFTKASLNIKFDEAKRDNFFREIGSLVYSAYKENPSSAGDEVKNFCVGIDELEESIKEQRRKIAALKGQKFCAECGRRLSASMKFCPSCGARQDEDECECGCGCDADCDCGCQEGGDCTCGDDCADDDCGCGCKEDGDCTCG